MHHYIAAMRLVESRLAGPLLLEPVAHGDGRGFFVESYRANLWAQHGVGDIFMQDNHSRSQAVSCAYSAFSTRSRAASAGERRRRVDGDSSAPGPAAAHTHRGAGRASPLKRHHRSASPRRHAVVGAPELRARPVQRHPPRLAVLRRHGLPVHVLQRRPPRGGEWRGWRGGAGGRARRASRAANVHSAPDGWRALNAGQGWTSLARFTHGPGNAKRPAFTGCFGYRYGDSKSASRPVEYGFSLLSPGFVPLAGG